ncbi:MAG: hypothetical protein AAF581_02695 [Planctomycetota bacterium]
MLPNTLGAIGAALIVGAYLLLQLGKVSHRAPSYSLANAVGAALILVSLYYDFNPGAAVVEGFWLLVSFIGLYRHWGRGAETSETSEPAG